MRKKEAENGAPETTVSVWADDELVLKNISSMGLYETRRGRAIVVCGSLSLR